MTKLNIDRVGDSYTVDYSAAGIEFIDTEEFIELIDTLYNRQGSVQSGDKFIVNKFEFHGQFKAKE